MKAIILAAGRGSRMKNLTDDKPKYLVKLHQKLLLERQLESLCKSGINKIAIVTGYKHKMLSTYNLAKFQNICNSIPLKEMNSLDMIKTLQMFLQKSLMTIHTISYNGKWGEVDSETDLQYY